MNIKGILRVSFVAPVCVYCVMANQEAVGEFTGVEEVIFSTSVPNEVLHWVREATLCKLPDTPEYKASVQYIEDLLQQHLRDNTRSDVDSDNYTIQKELDDYAREHTQWNLDSFTGANWNYILLCQIIMDVQKYKFVGFDAMFTIAITNLTTRNKEYAKYKDELELASLDLRVYLSEGYHAIMDMAFYIQNCGVRMMSTVDKFYIDDNRLDPQKAAGFNCKEDNKNDESYQDVSKRILRQLTQKLAEEYPWEKVWAKLTGEDFKNELTDIGVPTQEIEEQLSQMKAKAEHDIRELRKYSINKKLKSIELSYETIIQNKIDTIKGEFKEDTKRDNGRIRGIYKRIKKLHKEMNEKLFEKEVDNLYNDANTDPLRNNYTAQKEIREQLEGYEKLIQQIDKIAKGDNAAAKEWHDDMFKRFTDTLYAIVTSKEIMSKYIQIDEKNEIIAYCKQAIELKINTWVNRIKNAQNKTKEYKAILEDMQLCIENEKLQCCQLINNANTKAVNRAIKVKHKIETQSSIDTKIKMGTVEAILGASAITVVDNYTKGIIETAIKNEYQQEKMAMIHLYNNNITQMWNNMQQIQYNMVQQTRELLMKQSFAHSFSSSMLYDTKEGQRAALATALRLQQRIGEIKNHIYRNEQLMTVTDNEKEESINSITHMKTNIEKDETNPNWTQNRIRYKLQYDQISTYATQYYESKLQIEEFRALLKAILEV